jgi:two-component system, NtrC family, sensor histidine kinase GlrK
MRLAWKVFLSTSLVMVVLVGIAAWSLRAVNQYVHLNGTLIARSVPALRLETSVRETMLALMRLETRWTVLKDPAYETLWRGHADKAEHDLERLAALITAPDELRYHRKGQASFLAYRRLALAEQAAPPDREVAIVRETRAAAARTEIALSRLTDATYATLEMSQEDARRLELRTWNAVFTALPIAVLAGIVGAALVAFGMTRALRLLSSAASEIAQGNFTKPVPVRSGDEIGQLATSFNHMAEQLGELERMKEDFFAHISHELRTPLTATREATSLLRDEVLGPLTAKQARLVEIIRASSERVLGLVNRILELSRLQAGLLGYDQRWVDLDRIIGRAVDELRPQAEASGVALECNGTRPAGGLVGDEERLLQVVVNLLSNAIKFTPAGGAVRVATVDRGNEVEIAVEDTGAGIAPDALPHVFDRYWRASDSRGGSGLGLAIVKSIVQAHGGNVRAESSPGAGSRFSVRLPRRRAAA